MKRAKEIAAIFGIVGALSGGQENIAEAEKPDKEGAIQKNTKHRVKIALDKFREEKIMDRKSAAAELEMLKKEERAVFAREEGDAKIDNFEQRGIPVVFSIAERAARDKNLQEDKEKRRESRLVGFAFINFDVKRYTSIPWYKADLVVYQRLDDERVKRMYLSAEQYMPERYSMYGDGNLQIIDHYGPDFLLDTFAYRKAREICGFKYMQ